MTQAEAFALTIGIELLVAIVALVAVSAPRTPRALGAVVLASVITHPALWAVAEHIPPQWWWEVICALELGISVVEGGVLATIGGYGARRGLAVGVAMNAVSFGVGVVIAPWWRL